MVSLTQNQKLEEEKKVKSQSDQLNLLCCKGFYFYFFNFWKDLLP